MVTSASIALSVFVLIVSFPLSITRDSIGVNFCVAGVLAKTKVAFHSCGGSHGIGPFIGKPTVFPVNPEGFAHTGTTLNHQYLATALSYCRQERNTPENLIYYKSLD